MRLAIVISLCGAFSAIAEPWRAEISASPVVVQLNNTWEQHVGVGANVAFAVSENMRVTAGGVWNHTWHTTKLPDILSLGFEALGSRGFFIPAAAWVGTEFVVINATIEPFHFAHRLEWLVSGMAGVTSRRIELRPESVRTTGEISPATSGDIGAQPIFGAGTGFRFSFLDRFSIRLEIRYLTVSTGAKTVNGCTRDDLTVFDAATRSARPINSVTPSATCDISTFLGNDQYGRRQSNDVPLALSIVRNPGGDTRSFVTAQLSVGVAF